ncbi:hypothetical protein F4774DRAFT_424958 [Daldinia eschscholtzii]|nr:hypothetical protein F4774DRAFT_424958 [Daldinia eschscholtzii]
MDLNGLIQRGRCYINTWIIAMSDGLYRPLAAFHNWGEHPDFIQEREPQAHKPFFWLKSILSDPANRIGIEAERDMAKDFHPRGFRSTLDLYQHYPFLSSCLLLGIAQHRSWRGYQRMFLTLEEEFSFRDPVFYQGISVVYDITNLDNLRCGILLSTPLSNRPLRCLSASQFMEEVDFASSIGDIETLLPLDPVNSSALLSALGASEEGELREEEEEDELMEEVEFSEEDESSEEGHDDNHTTSVKPAREPLKSLTDFCIKALMGSTAHLDSFEKDLFDAPRRLPHFRDKLRRNLLETPRLLGRTRAAGRLLGLAFEDETNLNLVEYRALPTQVVRYALETEEMSKVASLGLCIGSRQGSAVEIVDAISNLPSLRYLHLFQRPTENEYRLSKEVYGLLIEKLDPLRRVKVTFAGAYAMSLKMQPWVGYPTATCPPPAIFPVQHMFIRDCRPDNNSRRLAAALSSTSYDLTGALLGPEAFAATFLRYLWQPAGSLTSFSAGPASLGDLTGMEIRPAPNAVERPKKLMPGAWILLLSVEGRERAWPGLLAQAVRYALVRLNDPSHTQFNDYKTPINLTDITVTGLQSFLSITAPTVDRASFHRAEEETINKMASWVNTANKPLGLDRLSVMRPQEALLMLNGCVRRRSDSMSAVHEN